MMLVSTRGCSALCLMVAMLGPLGCTASAGDSAAADPRDGGADAGRGVAVVELFTSEGCSSCPPADRLLGEIIEEATEDGRPVYAVAYHVDYWDRLGWKDPFSDAAWSRRQREYARIFDSNRVYTPQMIVNGREEFVGSNGAKAEQAIEEALDRPAPVALRLETRPAEARKVTVRYQAHGLTDEARLQLVLVEREALTDVPRGENRGRKLEHANVVRAARTLTIGPDQAAGEAELPLPDDLSAEDALVIGYVQNPADRAVLGAASASPGA